MTTWTKFSDAMPNYDDAPKDACGEITLMWAKNDWVAGNIQHCDSQKSVESQCERIMKVGYTHWAYVNPPENV